MRNIGTFRLLFRLLAGFVFACAFISCGQSDSKNSTPAPGVADPNPLTPTPNPTPPVDNPVEAQDNLQIFFMPSLAGHSDFISLVTGAKSSINLAMFMITNSADADALIAAAKRNVNVRVILDGLMLNGPMNSFIKSKLQAGGVIVKASSSGFSISHEKSMTIDAATAMISTINLTNTHDTNRGIGIITKDLGIVKEFNTVFNADWANADSGTQTTPTLSNAQLLWSPQNSSQKLIQLIQSAKTTIEVYVENFSSETIANALVAAATRGVKVRVLTPLCNEGADPYFNFPMTKTLNSKGVDAKLMKAPATLNMPYIHAKAIVVDGKKSYVGSVNFTPNSLTSAREVGIIFTNSEASLSIQQKFKSDWLHGILPPNTTSGLCN